MKKILGKACLWAFVSLPVLILIGCQKEAQQTHAANVIAGKSIDPKELKDFVQINLVGNNTTYNPLHVDASLVNGWGIAFPSIGPAWVSSEGNGMSTIYNLDGVAVTNPVVIPCGGNSGIGKPTGHIANNSPDFKLPNGNPAQFIFATADGTISGWNNGSSAIKMVDRFSSASYMGIAMAPDGGNFFIYAANFAQNRIDVYDKNWNLVNKPFIDPDLPSGYAPFNITYLTDGKLFVMYAKKNASGKSENGQGNGYIDIFGTDGKFLKRFTSRGKLNAPWGITVAPAGFWGEWSTISNMILVGNYGDGQISVFDPDGNYMGPLYTHGKAIAIDGLWGLAFPPMNSYNHYYLYFAAGPNGGSNGLVGYIRSTFFN